MLQSLLLGLPTLDIPIPEFGKCLNVGLEQKVLHRACFKEYTGFDRIEQNSLSTSGGQ